MTKIQELEQKLNEASSGFEFVINEIRKELVSYKTQKELKESNKEDKWKPFHYEEYYGGGTQPLKRWKIYFTKYNILVNIEDNNGQINIKAA